MASYKFDQRHVLSPSGAIIRRGDTLANPGWLLSSEIELIRIASMGTPLDSTDNLPPGRRADCSCVAWRESVGVVTTYKAQTQGCTLGEKETGSEEGGEDVLSVSILS
ncbi:hypothetical protein CBL_03225 [Carabus blaptoides fortunei]